MKRIICFDIETTSFDYKDGDRIIEIGAIEIIDDEITDKYFHSYINPEGREIPDSSYKVHKLSNEFLKDKPLFKEIAPKFLDFIKDDEIVAHNGKGFDFPFINHELAKINLPEIKEEQQIDSIHMAKRRVWDVKNYTLDALAQYFNISLESRAEGHGALIDSKILANVYLELKKLKEQKTTAEMIQYYHKIMLEHPKIGNNFPKRHFPATEEELKEHEDFLNTFIDKDKMGR